ncbi:MAG: hypothetical protein SGI92_17525, partial [Bryobacteraceae bacterium]|nr:hypothetical protein [Bryobacteraceae bacterium]
MRSLILAVTALSCAVAADYTAPAGTRPAHAKPENTVLPGGRLLSPVGTHFMTGSGTFGIAVNDDGTVAASADGGPNGFSITIIQNGSADRLRTRRRGEPADDDDDDWRSVFMGLAFDGSGNLWSSEGNSGRVRLGMTKGPAVNLNVNGFKDSYTGDLVLDRQRGRLYVADQANFRVVTIDAAKRRVIASTKVGRLPFALAMSPDGSRLYVT